LQMGEVPMGLKLSNMTTFGWRIWKGCN
jgi:hypothetical protein